MCSVALIRKANEAKTFKRFWFDPFQILNTSCLTITVRADPLNSVQDFDYTPYYEVGSSHWMHSAVFSLEVSTWIVLWSISNSWLQMREASSKTIWELVLSSTGKIKCMLMLSYQEALSLRHYRDGNYEKLSDLFNRRTKRRYPIPSVELSIHLWDSPGLTFGSFTTWFRYIAKFPDDKWFHFFFRPSQMFVDT